MSNLSREAAREFIDAITEENGGITLEDRKNTPAKVLRSLANLRRKLGAATKRLAKDLYSKDTRFIYELIQNAEDNRYTRAAARRDIPYITFSIYPDRIVIDSNEDGFTIENVKAICSIGESNKPIQGYIGQKGIGFKSVFKVAGKVHIQSGPFSFFFEHRLDSDNDPLGMVTPMYEPHRDLPENVTTRMTLTLLNAADFGARVRDILELPDTLLLFLKKLKAITQIIHFPDGTQEVVKHTYRYDSATGLVNLIKTTTSRGASKETISFFHIIKRQLEDLPDDPDRRNIHEAEVVLAFPVDANSLPIIEPQYVYAFLPLRIVGFNFLIQSDFIAQANREDVIESPWNWAILEGVAEAFRDAVLQFCNHSSLQYQWMRYLPGDSISDDFWTDLQTEINCILRLTPILRSRSGLSLRNPQLLRYVPSRYCDRDGEPLFRDLDPEIYLSPKYQPGKDLEALRELGVVTMSKKNFIDTVEADLQSSSSKLRGTPITNEGWHTRVAKAINLIFKKTYIRGIQRIIRLPIIPMQNGSWVSIDGFNGPIYFPTITGIPIPTDLDIGLVERHAAKNFYRQELFDYLGVDTCQPEIVIPLILENYNKGKHMSLEDSVAHVRFLYWKLPPDTKELDKNIWLIDQSDKKFYPSTEHIYFESEEEYSAQQLLREIDHDGRNVRGHPVHFINYAYLQAVSPNSTCGGQSWKSWLEDFIGVRSYPQLLRKTSSTLLTDEFHHIIKNHPEKLVGLLKEYWPLYEPLMTADIVMQLSKSNVSSENCASVSLHQSYLPLPKLKSICQDLDIKDFPFLQMSTCLSDRSNKDWDFLKIFNVRTDENMQFYIDILARFQTAHSTTFTTDIEILCKIYKAIERHCCSPQDKDQIQKIFSAKECIYSPAHASRGAQWVVSKQCVWRGPDWLELKKPLATIHKYNELEHFFHVILQIPNPSVQDFLTELMALSNKQSVDESTISEIYHILWSEGKNWNIIRAQFEQSALCYNPLEKSWYSLSSCVWAEDRVRIPRKFSIATLYSGLEDFFVNKLGVLRPNLDMHVQTLVELANQHATVEEVKDTIRKISLMEPRKGALEDLNKSKIFPVKFPDGNTKLESIKTDFVIVDRSEYGTAFRGKVSVLDFSLEEVRAYRSFILALGLEGRYMSVTVKEKSTVEGGIPEIRLSDDLRQKSYALFRCAVHYNSPKATEEDRSLYFFLSKASIYESDGISKTLILSQGQQKATESTKGNFHLDQEGDQLRLYVPKNKHDREVCYIRQLPRQLLGYLGVHDPDAENVVGGIMRSSILDVVDDVLTDAGIIEVSGVNRPNNIAPNEQSQAVEEEEIIETVEIDTFRSANLGRIQPGIMSNTSVRESTTDQVNLPPQVAFSPQSRQSRRSTSYYSSAGVTFTPPPRSSAGKKSPVSSGTPGPGPPFQQHSQSPEPASNANSSVNQYIALLDRIINAASRLKFPSKGVFDLAALRDALPTDSDYQLPLEAENETRLGYLPFGVRSMNQIAHDMKIGAAGELYVFELLMHLSLPQFTLANWRSTIRHEVCVHPKYRTMDQWLGSETADIVYKDASSTFTQFLIDHDYLPAEAWIDATPTYFLEVKTTLKGCAEKFWVSKNQYARMQRMQLKPGRAARKVYAVLRVFNLDSKDIGLRVYLDPETLKTDGVLEFTAESYSVKPGAAGRVDD